MRQVQFPDNSNIIHRVIFSRSFHHFRESRHHSGHYQVSRIIVLPLTTQTEDSLGLFTCREPQSNGKSLIR